MSYRTIKHAEAHVGDIVRLFDGAFGDATVIKIADNQITFFRPWMHPADKGYPMIGVEIFSDYVNANKTLTLLRRDGKG